MTDFDLFCLVLVLGIQLQIQKLCLWVKWFKNQNLLEQFILYTICK